MCLYTEAIKYITLTYTRNSNSIVTQIINTKENKKRNNKFPIKTLSLHFVENILLVVVTHRVFNDVSCTREYTLVYGEGLREVEDVLKPTVACY